MQLKNLPSGHLSLSGTPSQSLGQDFTLTTTKENALSGKLYPALQEQGLAAMSDEEVLKAHLLLSHCSAFALRNLMKAGPRRVDEDQLTRVLAGCTCLGVVRRATPPKLTGQSSKFCGEIIGLDVVYPLTVARSGVKGNVFPALLIVDCLSRFAICALLSNVRACTNTGVLLNDWIRHLGKPRRIICDNGPPGMTGVEWGDFARIYCIQISHAPKQAPQQNGLAERAARSIIIPIRQLMLDTSLSPS